MAVANYADTKGHYPPAFVPGPDGRPWHSWRILILPYIEQDPLFKRYNFSEPWDGPNNSQLAGEMPRLFGFPGSPGEGRHVANYLAVVGTETMWPGGTPFRGLPKDGPSSTILLVENDGLDIPWMEPRDLVFSGMDFELQSPGGVSSRYKTPGVVMADYSIRTLHPSLSPAALRAMLTAAGGEKLGETGDGSQVIKDGRDRESR
ncbi:MAG: hypothetical protein JWO38_2630 [Gemmataceae bacterium]|nr:hypothetical protein [Gemmataceae bacterium]